MSSRPSRGAARLAAILDALPDALVLVNANGTVVNANTIALEAFETPGTALVGRGLLDLLPEFDSRLIPGSMRRPDHVDPRARTRPTRMTARRTDGSEFPVEVTSANLEDARQAYDGYGYTGDELLMLVVRDLSGTVDTEAELARSQRQTEMILRAASEGVVGTDTDGRIVLVNPAAAQILGYRANELGGKELHTLVLHSREDESPFPYAESPLADTLRSGRKHRVRGQVLWSKAGNKVPVDLTTAPVRDGDQLVGAVMTFTDRRPFDTLSAEKHESEERHQQELRQLAEEHAAELERVREEHSAELETLRERHAEELAAGDERYAALGEREKDRYEALTARYDQLFAVLGRSLRGPLDQLRAELSALAADDAGQLWPEANQVLHYLAAGYSRITTLLDNVLGFQRLDAGEDGLTRTAAMLDAVVAAGVDGAVELIGPGRVQFAVHAPPIEAEVDAHRLAQALAHLVADVAGVDATGNSPVSAGGYMDNTVVVAAAQRGEVVRIEVRGPYPGGDPVHQPIVRGIVRAHGGVLQTHEVPGMSGSAYVLEVPLGAGAGAVPAAAASGTAGAPTTGAPATGGTAVGAEVALVGAADAAGPVGAADAPGTPGTATAETGTEGDGESVRSPQGGGRRRARRASTDAFLDGGGAVPAPEEEVPAPTGRRRRRAAEAASVPVQGGAATPDASGEAVSDGTGRRRGHPGSGTDAPGEGAGGPGVSEGAVVTAAEHAAGAAATGLGATVPPQGVPAPTGRRARRDTEPQALPPALPAAPTGATESVEGSGASGRPTGRRRRALASAAERAAGVPAPAEQGARPVFALPPAEADRGPEYAAAAAAASAPMSVGAEGADVGRHDAVAHDQDGDHTPPQPHPVQTPTGRRRAAAAPGTPAGQVPGQVRPTETTGVQGQVPTVPATVPGAPGQAVPAPGAPATTGAAAPIPAVGLQGVQGVQQPTVVPGQPGQPVRGGVPGQALPVPGGVQAFGMPGVGGPEVAPVQAAAQAVPAQVPAQGGPVPLPGQFQPVPVPVMDQGGPTPGAPAAPLPGQLPPVGGAQPVPPAQGGAAAGAVPAQAQAAPVGGHGPVAQQPLPAPGPLSGQPVQPEPVPPGAVPQGPAPVPGPLPGATPGMPVPPQATPAPARPPAAAPGTPGVAPPPAAQPTPTPAPGTPLPPERPAAPRVAQPLPAEAAAPSAPVAPAAPVDPNSTQGRAISVRTLGQGVPFARQATGAVPTAPQAPQAGPASQAHTPPPHHPGGAGRRRKLGTPPEPAAERPETGGRPHPSAGPAPQSRQAGATEGAGRSYAIGAPDKNADEGPEPLDGPGGAVEIADQPHPPPLDDELPPEPLDNPRRLLVWPAPDVLTQQALSDRGYRPVIVNSREDVDAQIAAFPAALFVDPLTGPITRTALQALRQAAVAAEVPVMVTAGLGQASREAAYGADPAVLLKALAPRDSEQHPPRVLLVEEHAEIALALTATLERRGMQVGRAASDADAVALASQMRPNLVVMDLMQVRRRQAGVVDWLRANKLLNRTPLVIYTTAVDQAELPRLVSGETVLFLAERSTSPEVQDRIVDLLARIGTN
ncbi:PAS domain-containing protein [Streptomyces sp. B3I8]|uniref:PAS domain-containing protein n=1 Tax=Streptomyces sp. B3I8 TaxID=3042303 RepID=UPI002782BD6F|nr:PAS domain-containing protein [Streptomyces sp. B3I8]MDQ0787962.1 PAS domain S-box-containing protein [Streptomyces sp. B3I8]